MFPAITNNNFKSDTKQAILYVMTTHDMIMISILAMWLNQGGNVITVDWVFMKREYIL